MLGAIARRFFGTANDRTVKSLQKVVNAINEKEPEVAALTDDQLRARTAEFRQQLGKRRQT